MRRIRRAVAGIALASALTPAPAPAVASPGDAVVREINRERLWNGLAPLSRSPSLHHSSSRFARRLMSRNAFGHQARIAASSSFDRVGENLALHWSTAPRPRHTVARWLDSPSHRALVLSSRFRLVGVGRARGEFSGRGATIWVAHFGRR
ncbi:MAG: hypothetical protein H0U84_04975 [Thermoleophilaceae bacterium]|nr:hypothetical protein [Thermoleophilaceae bacterium]